MARKSTARTDADRNLLYVAIFILFDAAVFHEVIAGSHPQIASLRQAANCSSVQTFLDEQWREIRRIDYAPVFDIALAVLESFPSSVTSDGILKTICVSALEIVSSGILLRHDFMGRLYHKLLLRTTGHFYATYYTSVPAATLLSTLALRTPNDSWQLGSLEDIEKFRVIDPACGSGTLLSASYTALKDGYVLARPERLELARLHKMLIEQVIYGWDVLGFAGHLTLTTLALHFNEVNIRRSNIYALKDGVDPSGRAYLGSLEFLSPQTSLQGLSFGAEAERVSLDSPNYANIAAADYDLVVMNPPFSRSARPNLKFGYASKEERTIMSRSLSDLAKRNAIVGASQAGLGAFFMVLGLTMSKREDSRIAIVIPRSMLSGVSWAKVRDKYLAECEIEYVVSNYDPSESGSGVEPWNWSERTAIGEVLIVARKTTKPASERFTTYIGLWRKPANDVEATLVANQAVRASRELVGTLVDWKYAPLSVQHLPVGALYRVPQQTLERNWLAPCVFAEPELNRISLMFATELPRMTMLPSIASSMGADIKQVKDAFEEQDAPSAARLVVGHQGDMATLLITPEKMKYGRPKKGPKSIELHQRRASALLLADRPHLSTERLIAMSASEPVLATAFWELQLNDACWNSAILLWLNSTYGLLQYLGSAECSMGDHFQMKKGQMETMPVLDPRQMEDSALIQADAVLERVALEPFPVFPRQFADAATGVGLRSEIDTFFAEHADMPRIAASTYQQLAQDPVVTKRRR